MNPVNGRLVVSWMNVESIQVKLISFENEKIVGDWKVWRWSSKTFHSKRVRNWNLRSSDHFGGRRKCAVAQLITTADSLRPYMVLRHPLPR